MPIFHEVVDGPEFQRVWGLARRPIPDPLATESRSLAVELTRVLAKRPNPWPGSLYPTQALALREIWECRGAVLPIRTGGGKTLTAALAMAIMKPKRPLLVVPAAMLVDCETTWRRLYQDWRIPAYEDIQVLSYEKISAPSSGAKVLPDGTEIYPDIVARLRPDMVVMDEAHRFADTSAAGTRRMGRYLEANPSTVVVAMSGTLIRRSLSDAAHVLQWGLGDNAPLPCEWKELQAWSDATDPKPAKGKKTSPGALMTHVDTDRYDASESSEDARGVVCEAIGQRILETKGVVGSADGNLNIPASIEPYYIADEDEAIEAEYVKLLQGDEAEGRAAWSLPDGTLLADSTQLARPLNTLSFGFVLVQDPAPPEEYRLSSSGWSKAVRDVVKYQSHLNLDSEWQVRDAVERGLLPEHEETLLAWRNARAHYTATTGLREPPSKAVWFSDEVIGEVERWLKQGPGVIWCSWRALGDRLSKELQLPYFGAGKLDSKGRHVTKLKKGESAILSHASVGTGTDGIQHCHSRALWMCPPNEQSLARLWRPGFAFERVENFLYVGSGSCLARFWRAKGLADNFAGRLSGNAQKLSIIDNSVPERLNQEGRRWTSVIGSVDSTGDDA